MLITFEGPEGGGKSTQIKLFAQWLAADGYDVIITREPGGTTIGEKIRDLLHDRQHTEMVASAEILLYSASRAQLVAEKLRPHLATHIILCDRFYDSTFAYQGYGRGLDLESLRHITYFATGGLTPDLTFLLDLDVEVGLARRLENQEEMNRLDLEAVAFHQRVRGGYLELARLEARWKVVKADRPIDLIQADLRREFTAKMAVSPC